MSPGASAAGEAGQAGVSNARAGAGAPAASNAGRTAVAITPAAGSRSAAGTSGGPAASAKTPAAGSRSTGAPSAAGSGNTAGIGSGGATGSGNIAGIGAAGGTAGATADAGSGGRNMAGRSAAGSGNEGATAGMTPVLRIPLRVHIGRSELTQAELAPILQEMNQIWLEQAGVCFEIEVTTSEEDREDGFDFRYTSGEIPIARGSNGVYQDPHTIWSIDHPRLNDVAMPVMHPTARTTAHELGHALGLAHENPPPSNDCSRPCHCVELGDDCDEYLMRSGTKGFHLSAPEIATARGRAPRFALSDKGPARCGEPVFMP